MRTFILLTFIAMITGCQHAQRCTQACRSMSPLPTCKTRDAGNCREQSPGRPRCDLSNTCRSVQSKCQKVCQTPPDLGCKTPVLGWKEVRVPVLKLRERRTTCGTRTPCNQASPCGSKTCCRTGSPGCCRETPTPAMDPTPFLTVPAEAAVPQPSAWMSQPQQPIAQQPIATSTTTNLAQRTQALESQVNQLQSMLQNRQATNLPHDGYIDFRSQQPQQKEVIMLPPPTWRTMEGVPPIPNSSIEQTSGYRPNSGTYRTAGNPQMWQHSPQNLQRSMYR